MNKFFQSDAITLFFFSNFTSFCEFLYFVNNFIACIRNFFQILFFLLIFFKLLEIIKFFATLLMKHQQFERVDQFNIDFLKRFDFINYLCVFENFCWYSSSSKSTNFFQFENVQFFDTTKKTCESSFVKFLWWKLTTTWKHVRIFV